MGFHIQQCTITRPVWAVACCLRCLICPTSLKCAGVHIINLLHPDSCTFIHKPNSIANSQDLKSFLHKGRFRTHVLHQWSNQPCSQKEPCDAFADRSANHSPESPAPPMAWLLSVLCLWTFQLSPKPNPNKTYRLVPCDENVNLIHEQEGHTPMAAHMAAAATA